MTDATIEERPFAPGLIQGAVRGGVAGVFAAALGLLLLLLVEGKVEGGIVVALGVGIPCGAAVLGAADGIAARLGSGRARLLARLVGGMLAPYAGATPVFCLAALTERTTPWAELAATRDFWIAFWGLAILGLAVALALAIPGGSPRARTGERFFRIALGANLSGALVGLGMVVLSKSGSFAPILFGLALANAFAIALFLGHLVARPIGRSVGAWLEPHESGEDRIEARAAYDRDRAGAEQALRLGDFAGALACARAAFETAETGLPLADRGPATRALVEGLEERLESLTAKTPESDAFRAEVAHMKTRLGAAT
jgi:hypothetical protein